MKRLMSILCVILLITATSSSAIAVKANEDIYATVFSFDDGSYVVVRCEDSGTIRATNTITKNKSYTYYSSTNVIQWKFTLTGTFTYNGVTSSCTNTSSSLQIYNTAWYQIYRGTSMSGNTAYGTLTLGRKVTGVTIDEKTFTITMTCSKTGVVS